MKSFQKGFNLIELMIVVAIIGILAVVVIPIYNAYQAKSKLTASLAELSSIKTHVEAQINEGTVITDAASAGVGNTFNCVVTIAMISGAGTLQCSVLNAPPSVSSAIIKWTLGQTGHWTCVTTGASDADLAPKSCPQA